MHINLVGDGKRRIIVTEVFLHLLGYRSAQRRAVAVRAARFKRAVAYYGIDDYERRFSRFLFGAFDGFVKRVHVLSVGNFDDLPALSLVTFGDVFGKRRIGIALYGDVVAVVNHDEFTKLPGARQRGSLAFDTLHHAPVAAKRVSIVVYYFAVVFIEACRKHGFRHGKTHGVCYALSERARGSFHPRGMSVLGVTGSTRPELTKVLDIVHRYAVAEKMQQRIQQHGAVSRTQYKTVAIEKRGVFGVVAKIVREKRVTNGGTAQRKSGMPAVCLIYCLGGQHAYRVYGQLLNFLHYGSP